jgi:site-specific recombinase XerC
MTPLAPHITTWLRERLPAERALSPHTCDSYAYAFQLLLTFAGRQLGVAPFELAFEHLDAPLVLTFLEHLQRERGNGARTRNARLVAIKSFMRFMQHRHPAGLDQIRRVLAIPGQRVVARPVTHLRHEEVQALLDAPDPARRDGLRDRALLLLGVAAGLRVSELIGLRLDQLSFRDRYVDIYVLGKGRKERCLTLWREVADGIRAWLAVRGEVRVPELV